MLSLDAGWVETATSEHRGPSAGTGARQLLAFCDESSTTKAKFFVLGAVLLTYDDPEFEQRLRLTESALEDLKQDHGLGGAKLKWERLPTSSGRYFEGYRSFVVKCLSSPKLVFRCFVVDTSACPINHNVIAGGNWLTGYLKHSSTFLGDILGREPKSTYADIRIDRFTTSKGNDESNLQRSLQARTRVVCQVRQFRSVDANLLQLADLLCGAVAFKWNGGMLRSSRRALMRQDLIRAIEKVRRVDLASPTSPHNKSFNIWQFQPSRFSLTANPASVRGDVNERPLSCRPSHRTVETVRAMRAEGPR